MEETKNDPNVEKKTSAIPFVIRQVVIRRNTSCC